MSVGINETSAAPDNNHDGDDVREAVVPAVLSTGPRAAPRLPENREVG